MPQATDHHKLLQHPPESLISSSLLRSSKKFRMQLIKLGDLRISTRVIRSLDGSFGIWEVVVSHITRSMFSKFSVHA